jgi:aldehyde:ferredoxin oxidoreductase
MKKNGHYPTNTELIEEMEAKQAAAAKREGRENILAMNRENAANVAARPDLAMATIGEQSLAIARRLTEAEEDQMQAEHAAMKLANFGDKAGKHGPAATVKRPMMLHVPRERYLALVELANELGPSPTTLVTELAIIASRCPSDKWYSGLQAFERAVKG